MKPWGQLDNLDNEDVDDDQDEGEEEDRDDEFASVVTVEELLQKRRK